MKYYANCSACGDTCYGEYFEQGFLCGECAPVNEPPKEVKMLGVSLPHSEGDNFFKERFDEHHKGDDDDC